MRKQDGYVLVSVAVLLVVLLGFAALAIDVGFFYTSRTDAQAMVDAAALAGAFTFIANPDDPQPQTAEQHALQVAQANNVLGREVEPAGLSVIVDTANRRVTVGYDYQEGTFFARAWSFGAADIAVRGVAEAARSASGSSCSKPWFIPNTVLSTKSPCGSEGACESNEVLIGPNGAATPFAQARVGTEFSLRSQQPSGALAPGQFFAIRLAGSTGANDYRNNIARCSEEPVRCSQCYGVETGNMVGPTVQGVRELIGDPADSFVTVGQYRRADGTVRNTSRSLVVAPIWDLCGFSGLSCPGMPSYCPDGQFPTGVNVTIPVVGFALIFLKGVQGNEVRANLIGIFPCDWGGLGDLINPEETGPYAIPLRLVRLPSD